jgi:hypothetical protein
VPAYTATVYSTAQLKTSRATSARRLVTSLNAAKKGRINAVQDSTTAEEANDSFDEDAIFLDSMTSPTSHDAWYVDVAVNGQTVNFKIDTGADATVIPASLFNNRMKASLQRVDRNLYGPNMSKLDVAGKFKANLRYKNRSTQIDVYVIRQVRAPLLGRHAAVLLNLVQRIDAITACDIRSQYPKLFNGLGCMTQPYTIRLEGRRHTLCCTLPTSHTCSALAKGQGRT